MPTAFLTRRDVSLPRLSVSTNFDRDSAKEVREFCRWPEQEGTRAATDPFHPPEGRFVATGGSTCYRGPPEYTVSSWRRRPPHGGLWWAPSTTSKHADGVHEGMELPQAPSAWLEMNVSRVGPSPSPLGNLAVAAGRGTRPTRKPC
jgi:hypothetical protein